MSKKATVFIVIGAIVVSNAASGFIWYKTKSNAENKLTQEISTLNATLTALGPPTTVWGVSGKTKAGATIQDNDLVELTMPSSVVQDNYITNKEDVVGSYYKIPVNPGTPLTTDMIMKDKLEDSMRDVDIVLEKVPVGTDIGDYVDIRYTTPGGEDFIVLSHIRIQDMGDATFKVYLTENQQQTYLGALVDRYSANTGMASLYATKYIEPGVQEKADQYYQVPDNVKAVMAQDPNIVNKAEFSIYNRYRKYVDSAIENYIKDNEDDVKSDLKAAKDKLEQAINQDFSTKRAEQENAIEGAEGNSLEEETEEPLFVEGDAETSDKEEEEVLE